MSAVGTRPVARDEASGGPAAKRRDRSTYAFVVLVAVALAPLLVSAARLLVSFRSRYDPVFDHAVIELTVRAVGRHAVVVGMPSRFGWFHPGPLLFYVLALPYRLLGSVSVGLHVGALLINGASIVGIALVARRRGGLVLALWALVVVGLLCHAAGPDFVRDPWPPYVSVLPFFLFVMLAWSAAVGDAWALPWAVVVGTLIVQTHVGYLISVAALLVWATAALVVRTVRAGSPATTARLRAAGGVAGGVGLLLWVPTLYDEIFASHNLSDLVSYFTSSHDTAGLRTAWRVLELQLDTRPEWLFGPRHIGTVVFAGFSPTAAASPVVVLLVLAAIGVAVVWRLRRLLAARSALVLAATSVVAIVTSLVAVSGIVGPVFVYLVRWTWVVGAVLGLLVVWVALIGLQMLSPRRAGIVTGVAGAAVVTLSIVMSVDVMGLNVPQSDAQPLIRDAAAQLLARLGPDHRAVTFTGSEGSLEEIALALQLSRHGIPVRMDHGHLARELYVAGGRSRRVLRVVSGDAASSASAGPGEAVLARASQALYPPSLRRQAQHDLAGARRGGAPASVIQALEAVARSDARQAVVVFGRLV